MSFKLLLIIAKLLWVIQSCKIQFQMIYIKNTILCCGFVVFFAVEVSYILTCFKSIFHFLDYHFFFIFLSAFKNIKYKGLALHVPLDPQRRTGLRFPLHWTPFSSKYQLLTERSLQSKLFIQCSASCITNSQIK